MVDRKSQGRDSQGQFTPGSEEARKAGRKGGKESSGGSKSRGGNRGGDNR